MAGPFGIFKYETDEGETYPIRLQPETVFAENPEGTGSLGDGFVRARGSKRKYGRHARYLTLARTVGSADYGSAKTYARLPVLLPSAFIDFAVGTELSYQGVEWEIVSKTPESLR
jgi:hypothetical protein